MNELLEILKYHEIEYRKKLNLPQNSMFGVEIEYEDVEQLRVRECLNYLYKKGKINSGIKDSAWISKGDITVERVLNGKVVGGEISSRILKDDKKNWKELKIVCNELKRLNAITTKKTALHIHADQSILGVNITNWLNLIKLWIIYEDIIYRFCYGTSEIGRPCIKTEAEPLREKYLNLLKTLNNIENLNELLKELKIGKRYGLNFMNTNLIGEDINKNTIELRVSNGTIDIAIIQNTINFFVHFLASTSRIPSDFLDYRLKNLETKEIDIEKAIELANLIFASEIDKLNFLKQYIKNFNNKKGLTRKK